MTEVSSNAKIESAHFIGIGGAGMSGIALVLHERGCKVTGSDLKASHYVRELEDAGIEVHVGHEAATIDAVMPQVIVTSTAIPETNPEVLRAWSDATGNGGNAFSAGSLSPVTGLSLAGAGCAG